MEEKDLGLVDSTESQAVALAHHYLEKFVSQHTHYLSSRFISEALDVLRNVSTCVVSSNFVCHHGFTEFRPMFQCTIDPRS